MNITSDDILGKEAIGPEGNIIGVIMKLHIDKTKKDITGITIDQGFMKPELYIGINNIKNFGQDAVFLNKKPYTTMKGKKIVTAKGKIIGTVKSIQTKKNKITKITARKGLEKWEITVKEIATIGENIILKI